jgi:hypothetical protein
MKIRMNVPLALALAAALSASPALAQNGKGKGNQNRDRQRVEQRDDRRDRDDDDRWGRDDDDRRDRRQPTFERRSERRVPPGWCIGRGNPHNTPENCGYRDGRYRRYDSRTGRWYDILTGGRTTTSTRNSVSGGGSYEERHRAFHRDLERRCDAAAARAPRDLSSQLRVRRQCAAEHEAWHRRTGTRHR